ncbi:P-loop containing nucleoside triphosphate hydrolase protein [Hysterangium stoloniferum]|nr:P-loop containing nucleoside triphosphate hydrolase protein [Hysterangium stoloniferum]
MADINQQAANPGMAEVLQTYYRLSPLRSISMPLLFLMVGVTLLMMVFKLVKTRSPKAAPGNSILLTGSSDSGKTAIQCALVYGSVSPTHTSLQPTESLIQLHSSLNKPHYGKLVDIPGHARIRDRFKEFLPNAKAVVFVVDASTIARNGPEVAEHLHRILHAITSLPPSRRQPSLVILAHKCDLLTSSSSNAALAVSRVRTILERELEKRKESQAGSVGVGQLGDDEDADGEMGGLECSGVKGKGFKFQEWEGGEIQILGSSVSIGKTTHDPEKAADGLADFKQWLYELS